jgi:SAM-dependent methyltransferase
MKQVKAKPLRLIQGEWDSVAAKRLEQIRSGRDLSYVHVLRPCILRLCGSSSYRCVLDVGCGIGALTRDLCERANIVVGIDISTESIRLAREGSRRRKNVRFEKMPAEELSGTFHAGTFSLVVASMSLSAIIRLERAIKEIVYVMKAGAPLIATIPHPWFWPIYAGFQQARWFKYQDEIAIESNFRISLETTHTRTTFVHRPLERYVSLLRRHDLVMDQIVEPMPASRIQAKYPAKWAFPRFLAMKFTKG